ncbi:hypothetical protein HU200_046202 [Digitaria exilis]|uniref:Phytocyanin domain-containing protein n=1 Tax=Digitaria exilis TaxID=1010633 RepID=A0A835AYU5_9POAL|nr:hypothetical protein HU200_046202 [Digitaria exilis]
MSRPCSSNNNVSLVLALGFAAFVVASAATSHGDVFYVGDKDGWVSKPAVSYDRWAASHRFKVTDTLVFKYKKGADSLVVDRRHYDACDSRDPIGELRDGDSAYVLGKTGPVYFISGGAVRCKHGQKLMVVVTAEPPVGSQAPSPSPSLAPSTSVAAPPAYYVAESPQTSPPFQGSPVFSSPNAFSSRAFTFSLHGTFTLAFSTTIFSTIPKSTQYPSVPVADSPISLSPDQELPPFLVPGLAPRPSNIHPVSASSVSTRTSIVVPTLLVVMLTYVLF